MLVMTTKRAPIAPRLAVYGLLLSGFFTLSVQAAVIKDVPHVPAAVAEPGHLVADRAPPGPTQAAAPIGEESASRPLAALLTPDSLEQAPAQALNSRDDERPPADILGTLPVPAVLPLLGVGLIALCFFSERRLRLHRLRHRNAVPAPREQQPGPHPTAPARR